ncbi:MAG TPA: hypothetical protein VHP36_04335 [Chitinispirillaceae bacterium]|nr:hypothetical protein [Chitinispirillaceae bacterium]
MNENVRVTTDHNEIRRWIENHNGIPASVMDKMTPGENAGILRISFKGERSKEDLIAVSWEEFFTRFDQANLAFLYEKDIPARNRGNFYKFLSRDGE